MGEMVDIGDSCVASEDGSVVTWKGENYYRACGEPVIPGVTTCTKRLDHPGDIHEDMDGVRLSEPKGRMAAVVTWPLVKDMQEGFDEAKSIVDQLKPVFKEFPDVRLYGVVKETADQLIMILDGDG